MGVPAIDPPGLRKSVGIDSKPDWWINKERGAKKLTAHNNQLCKSRAS
jgi:hypothetical protein